MEGDGEHDSVALALFTTGFPITVSRDSENRMVQTENSTSKSLNPYLTVYAYGGPRREFHKGEDKTQKQPTGFLYVGWGYLLINLL